MGFSMSPNMAKHSFLKLFLTFALISISIALHGQEFLTASLNTPGDAGILSENCGSPYELILRRGADNDTTTSISIIGSGTATMGLDYQFPPGSFPAEMTEADTVLIIPITVINDGLSEGLESVHLQILFQAGVETDFITLETSIVDVYEVEIQSPTDTIVWCRDVPFVLLASTDAEEIFWSPAQFFDDSLGTAATVRPFESGWYYASVGDDECGDKDSVYFNLAIVEVNNPDTVFICLDGNGAVLQGNIEGLATEFVWIPSDSTLSNPLILNPVANPTITTTYILQSDIGVCIASDRVVVRVDSLPEDMHIDIAPEKPYYCAGEVVALFSPSYDTLLFPDITFMWAPDDGTFDSPLTLLNAALILRDTTTYVRQNINNACRSSDSITINVVPPSVPLSVTDTLLCPGEMFTVEVLSDQVTDPEWTPKEGLSCTKCLDPKVTVLGTPGSTLFYQFSGKILECPVGAVLTVRIPPLQTINISGDDIVCSGEMIPLTITNPNGLTDILWSISSGNASLSCTNCPNPIVTINAPEIISLTVTANTSDTSSCGAIGFFTFNPGQTKQFTGPTFLACLGDTVTVSTGDPNVSDLQWSVFQGDLTLSCNNCEFPVVTVNAPFNQLRFIGETSEPNFCNVSGTVTVNTFSEDMSNLFISPDPIATPIGQGASVTATLNAIPPPATIMWTVNGTTLTETGLAIEFNAAEELNFVEAKFINSKGCEQIDTISFVTVPPSYMIPNAFTPNNDDMNDRFKIIINGNIEIEEFLIFNRWGQLVYEAPEDDLTGWNGQFKNEPAASDTYVYKARIIYPDGRAEIAKGDVILLR